MARTMLGVVGEAGQGNRALRLELPGWAREVMDPESPGRVGLHVELREGFADHTVVVTVDGREAFHRSGVTTDEESGRAGAIDLASASGVVRIEIAVAPGDRLSSFDVDLGRHRHISVSLVGTGTVSVELSSGT